nr:MAG TPA: PNC27 Protein [Bacteriophage sp.]
MSNHWKDSQFWTKVQRSTSDVTRRLKEVGGNEETRYSLARYKKEKND